MLRLRLLSSYALAEIPEQLGLVEGSATMTSNAYRAALWQVRHEDALNLGRKVVHEYHLGVHP